MAGQAMANMAKSQLPKHLSPPVHESSSLWLVPTITSLLQKTLNSHQNTKQPNLSGILNQFSHHMTPRLVIQVINNQTNPFHALHFFNWSSNLNPNPNNYFHTHFCYIAITDKLLSNKLFSLARKFLESHDRFSDFMVGKFIKAIGELGYLKWAFKLFHHVKDREHGDCLFSYNAILGVLVKADKFKLGWGFFGQMIKEGVVKPDVSTYTTMINGFCQVGMIDYAHKLFDEMGRQKNLITYNTMVNGLCKKGLPENARKIFDEMIESGVCMPDVVTYTTLINGFCKKGDMNEAMRCFDEMVKMKVEPNVVTYNALINGLCANGDVDEAKKMMTRMRFNGLKSNLVSHTTLLKGYSAFGRSDEAIEHFKEMVELGLEVDEKSYAVIVNEYCKLRKPYKAIDLLMEMLNKGKYPLTHVYNSVLRSLIELDELDRAVKLLEQMPLMGSSPNFLSYNAVIIGLARAPRRMLDVEMLLNDMLQNGHKLDATLYSHIILGYCEDGNVDKAMKVFLEMIDESYAMNIEIFEATAKRLVAEGKSFEIENIFNKMKQKCSLTNIDGYQKVLDDCFQVNGGFQPKI